MTDAGLVQFLVHRIKPLLAGYDSEIQGAALADLLAIWLAGHVVEGDADATLAVRDRLLAMHIKVVCQLIEPNAKLYGE